jgi:hypothetical protein
MPDKVDYPDDQLLTAKQIALLANKPRVTIYQWLQVAPPENPVIKGSRVAYKALDVKVWLKAKTELKRDKRRVRIARRIAERILVLSETEPDKYLAILAIVNEPAKASSDQERS